MKFDVIGASAGVDVSVNKISENGGIEIYEIRAIYAEEQIPEQFKLSFRVPDVEMYSVWSPSERFDRHLGPNWRKRTTPSRLASCMPLHALVSADGKNRMTVALSDAKQQLTPAELDDLLYRQITVRDADSDAPEWKDNIDQLRAKIDVIDENLLYALNSRMKVSSQIGEYKKNNNIAIIQTARWDVVMAKVMEKGKEYGLSDKFLSTVFAAIHEASVDVQNEIISKQK